MKTLYLHIGMPKTGTTSIQNFLCQNRSVLEKNGFCYPDFGNMFPKYAGAANGLFMVKCFAEEMQLAQDTQEQLFREGMKRVQQLFGQYDNIIISNERIFRATYERRSSLWQELKEAGEKHGFSVKIILFLRRQDLYLASHYNQKVKLNIRWDGNVGTKTWEEYLKLPSAVKHSLDYYGRLEQIRAVLGKDAVIVRRFEKQHFYGGSLYSDFLHVLGLEYTREYQLAQEEYNKNLPGNTVEIMRILNEVEEIDSRDRQLFLDALLLDGKLSTRYYKTSMFSKEEAEALLEKYKEGNQKIAEEYIQDGEALFDDTIADLPKYNRRNEYMIDDVIRFAALSISQLRKENDALGKEVDKLGREIGNLKSMLRHPGKTILKKIRH